MKKQITFVTQLIAVVCIFMAMKANGQFTAPGAYTENAFGATPVQARHVSNDVLEYGGDIYRVAVWEPGSTGDAFGWDVVYNSNPHQGVLPLSTTSSVFHTDVCLAATGTGQSTRVYAFAVYNFNNIRWRCDVFVWDPSSLAFKLYTTVNLAAGNFGTTINVDGSGGNSLFVIVWDDNAGNIYAVAGDVSGGTPSFSGVNNLPAGTSPDVSLYHGSSKTAHVTYLDGNGDLVIDDWDMNDLLSNTGSATNVFGPVSPSSGYSFFRPRIACPEGSSGSVNELTVVVEHADPASIPPSYQIVGFNNLSTTPIVYNDGNIPQNSPADITNVPNYNVAVAYDSNYPTDGIWVGWTFDNSSGINTVTNNKEAIYPIVVKCDDLAIPVSGATYWEVANAITSGNGDYADCLALSGRYVTDELFLTYAKYYDNMFTQVDEVYYKIATNVSSATSFREFNNEAVQVPTVITDFLAGLNESKNVLQIFDSQGKLIYREIGDRQTIRQGCIEFISNSANTLYFGVISTPEGQKVNAGKLFFPY